MEIETIDHKSSRALAIDFLDWFDFASVLLFYEESLSDNVPSKFRLWTAEIEETHQMEAPSYDASAARYIGWILSPVSKSNQDSLVDSLTKISESCRLKQCNSASHDKEAAGCNKRRKKPKFFDKDYTLAKDNDCQTIGLWLKEFEDRSMWYWNRTANTPASCEAKPSYSLSFQPNPSFRRIPLGILIGCSNYIDEDVCQMLLQYAATGRVLPLINTKSTKLKHVKWSSVGWDGSVRWTDKCTKREAVAGARLVFRLTDTVESMSDLLFESEESRLQFILRVKLRACKYLINCIKRIIHLTIEEDGALMLVDLSNRWVKWKHQGQVSEVDKDLDAIINGLGHKLSPLRRFCKVIIP